MEKGNSSNRTPERPTQRRRPGLSDEEKPKKKLTKCLLHGRRIFIFYCQNSPNIPPFARGGVTSPTFQGGKKMSILDICGRKHPFLNFPRNFYFRGKKETSVLPPRIFWKLCNFLRNLIISWKFEKLIPLVTPLLLRVPITRIYQQRITAHPNAFFCIFKVKNYLSLFLR